MCLYLLKEQPDGAPRLRYLFEAVAQGQLEVLAKFAVVHHLDLEPKDINMTTNRIILPLYLNAQVIRNG